jgi:hypothetical protein
MCLFVFGAVIILFYHFTLALLSLESLLISGGLFFLTLLLLVRLLTWQPKIKNQKRMTHPPIGRK